jgi:methylated-DNA-[protein]-cysteine S-methyltransferase
MELRTDLIESPIGDIMIAARDGVLLALEFVDVRERFDADLRARFGDCRLAPARNPFGLSDRIRGYFAGDVAGVDAIAADGGGTEFQRQVWAALRQIPAGATLAYSELARKVGRPDAVRAVGAINGRNPISIVVPCHRVIGKDGSLTGYGGGVERKRWLLRHEGALLV